MDTEVRIRGVIILIVLVVAGYYAIPTYHAYKPGNNPKLVDKKVNLGLDLQGGMYLDIEVQVDDAVDEVARRAAQELEDAFIDNQVEYIHIESKGSQVEIEFEAGSSLDLEEEPYSRLVVQFDQNIEKDFTRLTVKAEEIKRIRTSSVDQALEVLRNRIDALGVAEPSLQRQGENNILIQLPGLTDREKAIKLIGTQAVLEFYLVNENATKNNYNQLTSVVKYEENWDKITQKVATRIPFVLDKKVVLTGEFIRDARVRFDQNDNQPYVSLSFDSMGADRFGRITEKNKGKRLAIVLDDKVQSAPVIREAILGGEASISGNFTLDEANDLALVLRSGSLPAGIVIREEQTVGASLGEDSIKQSLISLLIGGLSVFFFMMFYYRVSGSFASLALLLNLILIIAILAGFESTLTLPGMAGIVLTLGMAVDANVLIFERIREEMKRNGMPRAAVREGFSKAFLTIVDSNVTTLFAALALLQFGTGPVKGFAVTLSVGILSSMFTSIVVTRFLFDIVYLNRRKLEKISI
ncbi:protein translocase subunit SecD [Deltaproteobacteria bacterium TL4]